jgi:nicotinate-nucleotide adenylyltransferase
VREFKETENRSDEKSKVSFTEGRPALFGGTFNPVHYGHLRAAEEARESLKLEKVIFIPAFAPPLKSEELADPTHRFEMVSRAVTGNPFFEASDIECKKGNTSYTVETIDELKKHQSKDPLFLLGLDAFLDIPHWHEPEKLIGLCDFIVVNRPPDELGGIYRSPYIRTKEEEKKVTVKLTSGKAVIPFRCTPLLISASDIRKRLKEGRSIKYLLPESVESYIISNRLYT